MSNFYVRFKDALNRYLPQHILEDGDPVDKYQSHFNKVYIEFVKSRGDKKKDLNIFVRDFNNYGYQDEAEKRIITKFGDKLLETYRDFVKKVVSRYLENNAEHEAHNSDVMVASQYKEADMREQFIEILKK